MTYELTIHMLQLKIRASREPSDVFCWFLPVSFCLYSSVPFLFILGSMFDSAMVVIVSINSVTKFYLSRCRRVTMAGGVFATFSGVIF